MTRVGRLIRPSVVTGPSVPKVAGPSVSDDHTFRARPLRTTREEVVDDHTLRAREAQKRYREENPVDHGGKRPMLMSLEEMRRLRDSIWDD